MTIRLFQRGGHNVMTDWCMHTHRNTHTQTEWKRRRGISAFDPACSVTPLHPLMSQQGGSKSPTSSSCAGSWVTQWLLLCSESEGFSRGTVAMSTQKQYGPPFYLLSLSCSTMSSTLFRSSQLRFFAMWMLPKAKFKQVFKPVHFNLE